jgi:hypothetical protein
MIINRRGDLLVVTEAPNLPRSRWTFAAFFLVAAGMTQIGPHAGGTPSLVFAAFFGSLGLVGAFSPARRAEVDQRLRQVRIYNGWLWGWSRPRVIDFANVTGVDVRVNRSEEGPDFHSPRLLLKSGRRKWLLAGTSAADAENVARAVRHAIFGSS